MKQQIKPSSGPSEVKQLSPVACVMTLVIVAVVVVVVVVAVVVLLIALYSAVLRTRTDSLSSHVILPVEVLLYVHRYRRLIRDRSPGRPPRLSHSS